MAHRTWSRGTAWMTISTHVYCKRTSSTLSIKSPLNSRCLCSRAAARTACLARSSCFGRVADHSGSSVAHADHAVVSDGFELNRSPEQRREARVGCEVLDGI